MSAYSKISFWYGPTSRLCQANKDQKIIPHRYLGHKLMFRDEVFAFNSVLTLEKLRTNNFAVSANCKAPRWVKSIKKALQSNLVIFFAIKKGDWLWHGIRFCEEVREFLRTCLYDLLIQRDEMKNHASYWWATVFCCTFIYANFEKSDTFDRDIFLKFAVSENVVGYFLFL